MEAFERKCYQFILVAWLILSIVLSVAGLVNSYSKLTADLSLLTSVLLVAFLILGISLSTAAWMLFGLAGPLRLVMNLVQRERRKTHILESLVLTVIFISFLAFFLVPPRVETHLYRRLDPAPVSGANPGP